MPETAVAPAPAAASSPAPAAAPTSAPAPSSAPAAAPASTPAAAQPTFGRNSGVTSHVDPNQFQGKGSFDRNAYTAAVLAEQLASTAVEEVPAVENQPSEVETPAESQPVVEEQPVVEVPAPDVVEKPTEEAVAEPDFQLEPEAVVTPESLTLMVKENPEFGTLLENDPKLKGQLYKTAREAAELQPYREIFPDIESAKEAATGATAFNDVREVFMGSGTREGALAAIGKIAEMSYERDDDGNVVMQDGKPVFGEDFHGFMDTVSALEIEDKLGDERAETRKRFDANQYHLIPGVTQEQVNVAYNVDLACLKLMDKLFGDKQEGTQELQELPAHLQQKAEEITKREAALKEKEQGSKVQGRQEFEKSMQVEAKTRLETSISGIFKSLEKQGVAVSPYLKEILPQQIAFKVVKAVAANPGLVSNMEKLQRLQIGNDAKQRRLAAIDRSYQLYLGDIAREELRKAGIQTATNAAAKKAKVEGQIDLTKKTEIRGATAPAGLTKEPMSTEQAFATAEAEWVKTHPGLRFNRLDKDFLRRAVQLQLQ